MKDNKILTGKVNPVFFSFAIPVVLGLVASSSAGIIDGMFIGNYIGETALAAVTLCVPIFPFLMGIAILFSTGGEVFSGKFIGEGNHKRASEVFTKVIIVILTISTLLMVIGLVFLDSLVNILGADKEVHQMASEYLRIIIVSAPLVVTFSLSYFVRVDGKPNLSAASLLTTAIINIVLDYIFIVELNWGIKGAAWGTVLSYSAMPILLLPHFLLQQGNLRFVKPTKSLKILGEVAYNGSSEFFSEISGGILLFVINITMMKYYGNRGVAAYAVVGYLLYFTAMACYGVSDAIKSIISINFGAKQRKRISQFLRVAIITVVSFGFVLVILTQINSTLFVQLFLKNNADTSVSTLANDFILSISPVLLIIGTNIILSAYFTAIHMPKPSLIISLSRTLILPIILIPIITGLVGGDGIITALIISEIATLLIAILLVLGNKNKVAFKSLDS
ncbi:MAG: MATE family efflux transporter [Marinifilaceae bacterium]|jgi:putative MATE family efflux protein|nr:MATE family efflux transporter [Marinifilaceae bacterium]